MKRLVFRAGNGLFNKHNLLLNCLDEAEKQFNKNTRTNKNLVQPDISDANYVECDKCHRKSYSEQANSICNMPQPNGRECNGLFKKPALNPTISDWLLKNGFLKCHDNDDFDCVMRLHTLHYLFWSEKLKHFSIGVLNDTRKKGSAGVYKKWNVIMIPKPVYTIEQASVFLTAIIE